MARQEEPREDLLREATALVECAEMQAHGDADSVVAGFRRDGAASFFFGQQIVYQFNTSWELRRAFLDGKLYKAQRGKLVQLTRERTAREVNLVRHELAPLETAQLLGAAARRLQELQSMLANGKFQVLGQLPPDANVVDRIRNWLGCLPGEIAIASSPRVG